MSQQHESPTDGLFKRKDANDGMAMFHWLCTACSTTVTPFIRTRFGAEALGFPGIAAVGLLYFVFLATGDLTFCVWIGLLLVFIVIRRVQSFRLRRQGHVIHSRHSHPWLGMKMPLVKTVEGAYGAEMMICFLAGLLLCPLSTSAGGFMMLCGVAAVLKAGIEQQVDRQRVQAMQDAMIQQQSYAEQFRKPQ